MAGPLGFDQRPLSEINVTPFVDVMLVLLVIFMVTAPMMMLGEDVNLPVTSSQPIHAKEERLVLTLTKDKGIYLNDQKTSLDTLREKLTAIRKTQPEVEVFLKADSSLPYGQVVKVISYVRASGIKKLGMVTQPGSEKD